MERARRACVASVFIKKKANVHFVYVLPTSICPMHFFSGLYRGTQTTHQLRGSASTRTFINLQLLKCHPTEPNFYRGDSTLLSVASETAVLIHS